MRERLASIPLLVKFCLLSLTLVLLAGVVTGAVLVRQVQARALASAERVAASVADTAVRPGLAPSDLQTGTIPPQRLSDLENRMKIVLDTGAVVHVNVFDATGKVVWADRSRLRGTTGHRGPGLVAALAGDNWSKRVEIAGVGPVLETYVPLRFTAAGPVEGVFELYTPYGPIESDMKRDSMLLMIVLGISLLALWGALIKLVSAASKALRASARNEWLARRDPLTGLWNRRAFEEKLQASASESRPLSILLVDVDRFKSVNDRFGHTWGDIVIQLVSEKLSAAAREVDFVARLGGDEFAVVLHEKQPQVAAERIAAAFANVSLDIEGETVRVAASFGLAMADSHEADPDAIVQRADVAMYAAKRSENRLEIWDLSTSAALMMPGQQAPRHSAYLGKVDVGDSVR